MVKQRFSSADGAPLPLAPAVCAAAPACFDSLPATSCNAAEPGTLEPACGAPESLQRPALPASDPSPRSDARLSRAPLRSPAVAAEAACLRQRCLGMRVANVYDINPKASQARRLPRASAAAPASVPLPAAAPPAAPLCCLMPLPAPACPAATCSALRCFPLITCPLSPPLPLHRPTC